MKSGNTYNILAVDDELINLEALQRTFRNLYRLFTTTSPHEALQIFKSEEIHLVIADQRMPEMNGTELLGMMKQISPHPIRIVLSAYTDTSYLIEAINQGEVYRYITKPWNPDDLKITVQKALEHYQANMERIELTRRLQQANLELNEQNKTLQRALKELQEAQERVIELERFSIIGKMAGLIVHDLKQPLDIIRSAAETMAKMDLDAEERISFSEMIKYESERFLDMTQEILEYSRGEFHLEFDELKLSDFWTIAGQNIKNLLQNYDVDLRFFSDNKEATIRIDLRRFLRALLNLIKNSLEAFDSQTGNKKAQIVLRNMVTNGEVIFEIEDNGPGIPPDLQDRIFSPFVSNNKPFGIGLGLAIVKQIVKEHDGRITFSSIPGVKTVFTISLKKTDRKVQ
ncbi:MAG: response regulator [Calditrichia bacterium]